jgi:hypothetical protein
MLGLDKAKTPPSLRAAAELKVGTKRFFEAPSNF